MNDHAKYTNGVYELPPHARGVLREDDRLRVPGGERSHVDANAQRKLELRDPRHPEAGWALR
jgi:hypothetical protein